MKNYLEKYKVKFRMLPNDIIKAWVENSELIIREIATNDAISKKFMKVGIDIEKVQWIFPNIMS